jgi:putative hydrolase of the HAD superfamily
MNRPVFPGPDWPAIDAILLDLDGTLLDQAYDNHIWGERIPQEFARARRLTVAAARDEIARRYAVHHGTMLGYSIDYWSRELGVDITALHRELRAEVQWLPGAREFLQRMRAAGKRLVLLTNSHPAALAVKNEQTRVLDYLDESASSHEFGFPKEDERFWPAARARFGFDPARSLFADDNPRVLAVARAAGIRWVYGINHWDSSRERREHGYELSVDGVCDLDGAGAAPSSSYRPPRR